MKSTFVVPQILVKGSGSCFPKFLLIRSFQISKHNFVDFTHLDEIDTDVNDFQFKMVWNEGKVNNIDYALEWVQTNNPLTTYDTSMNPRVNINLICSFLDPCNQNWGYLGHLWRHKSMTSLLMTSSVAPTVKMMSCDVIEWPHDIGLTCNLPKMFVSLISYLCPKD